jgi:hypothetical protein
MPGQRRDEFGQRRPAPLPALPPAKRSRRVALLLVGTVAAGGGAYGLMPRQNCDAQQSAMATEPSKECPPGGSSSSGHGGSGAWHQSGSGGGSAEAQRASGSGAADAGTSHTARGGFGSFAHAFSGGG